VAVPPARSVVLGTARPLFATRWDLSTDAVLKSLHDAKPPGRGPPVDRSRSRTTARAGAKELGATVVAEPFDVFDATRMAMLTDPHRAALRLQAAQPDRRRPGSTLPVH
jgi:hypothetical protein